MSYHQAPNCNIDCHLITYENKVYILKEHKILNHEKNESSFSRKRSVSLTFVLNGGKYFISFRVIYKTVFGKIVALLEIAKLVHFDVDLGIE